MKTSQTMTAVRGRRPRRAFTLNELMVATSVFSFVVIGIIVVQMFGMKMHLIAETKMSATAAGRKALNRVRNDVLEGKILNIQTKTSSTNVNIPVNSPQIGNALKIYPTAAMTSYVLYYMDSSSNCLTRFSSADDQTEVLAINITNQLAFQAEDFRGNVLTNNQNNRVIRMVLEFSQEENLGRSGKLYDSYRLQTRITRRAID